MKVENKNMSIKKNNPLRLDVSYLIKQSPGTFREYEFNFPRLELSEDLVLMDVEGNIAVSVTDDGVVADGDLRAYTQQQCTRCLQEYRQPLEIKFTEMFVFHPNGEDGEMLEHPLPPDAFIDLTPLIRDYALLDIPIRHLCQEDCQGLCPVCGTNLNEEDCGHRQEDIDPRMAKLKQFLDEDELAEIE